MSTNDELWVPISGYEGIYEVSSKGRVCRIKNGERILRKINNCTHYPTISFLKRPYDIRQNSKAIHRIVAEAFLGPRPLGSVIRHIDGNRYNSEVTNLCYGTLEQNTEDSIIHGTFRGSRNGRAVLCEKGAEAVRMLIEHGLSLTEIAKRINVSVSTIHAIKTGRNWR